jgi:hypothetical protein
LAVACILQHRLREAGGWIQRGLREHPQDEVLRQLRFKLLLCRAAAVCKRILGLPPRASRSCRAGGRGNGPA